MIMVMRRRKKDDDDDGDKTNVDEIFLNDNGKNNVRNIKTIIKMIVIPTCMNKTQHRYILKFGTYGQQRNKTEMKRPPDYCHVIVTCLHSSNTSLTSETPNLFY